MESPWEGVNTNLPIPSQGSLQGPYFSCYICCTQGNRKQKPITCQSFLLLKQGFFGNNNSGFFHQERPNLVNWLKISLLTRIYLFYGLFKLKDVASACWQISGSTGLDFGGSAIMASLNLNCPLKYLPSN